MTSAGLRTLVAVAVAVVVAALAGGGAIGPTAAVAAANQPPGAPLALTVDDSITRLAVSATPRFSWQVTDRDPDEVQSAYEILVTRTPTTHPTDASVVWDSGLVSSAEQTYVPYGGPARSSSRSSASAFEIQAGHASTSRRRPPGSTTRRGTCRRRGGRCMFRWTAPAAR